MPYVVQKVMDVDYNVAKHTPVINKKKITYFLGKLLVSCFFFSTFFFFLDIWIYAFNSTSWRKAVIKWHKKKELSGKTAHGQGQMREHSEKKIKS